MSTNIKRVEQDDSNLASWPFGKDLIKQLTQS